METGEREREKKHTYHGSLQCIKNKEKFISYWSQICRRSFHRGAAQASVRRHNRSLRRHKSASTSFRRSSDRVLTDQFDVWNNNDTPCSDDRISFPRDNGFSVWYRPVWHVPQECSNRSCRERLCSGWSKPVGFLVGYCWMLSNLEERKRDTSTIPCSWREQINWAD